MCSSNDVDQKSKPSTLSKEESPQSPKESIQSPNKSKQSPKETLRISDVLALLLDMFIKKCPNFYGKLAKKIFKMIFYKTCIYFLPCIGYIEELL